MSFHGLQACWNLLTQGHGLLACTAELRQMRELDDGTINCLAVGDVPVAARLPYNNCVHQAGSDCNPEGASLIKLLLAFMCSAELWPGHT